MKKVGAREVRCVGVSGYLGEIVLVDNEPCECCGRRPSDYVIAGRCCQCGQPGAFVNENETGKVVYCQVCDMVSVVGWSGAQLVPTEERRGNSWGADEGVR